MTASPFGPYANSTITLKGAPVLSEDESGVAAFRSKDFTLTAVLNPTSLTKSEMAGIDQSWAAFEGFLVDPLTLSNQLANGAEGTARMKVADGIERTGRCRLIPVVQNPYVQSTKLQIINRVRVLIQFQVL